MTKSPQRARDASKAESATRQRKNIKRTSEPPKAVGKAYKTIGVTAEEFFKAWSRKDRAALIEVLIESLDAETGDPDLEDGGDIEPNLAGYEHCLSCADDAEADYSDDEPSVGFDGRELDEADDPRGEGVNEDGDGNPDDEPSLGWTDEEAARGRTYSGSMGRGFDLEGESAQ